MINKTILRQYDIRGVWGNDLTEDVAFQIGQGFSTYLIRKRNKANLKVSVGRDVRLSSKPLRDSLIEGITSSGIDVVDLGVCPTPLQYFSIFRLGLDGGVMITGSHNPPEFNGFKLSVGEETLYGDEIQAVGRIIDEGIFARADGKGDVSHFNIIDEYTGFLKGRFKEIRGPKVIIDAGNGTAGLVAPDLLSALGCDVTCLYCEPDGRFPNHHPDPVVEKNLKDLISEVKNTGADLGIGYDGDADRIGVVDSDGEIIWGDKLMIIFSRDILRDNPGATIIGDVKCSQSLYDDIKSHGGNPIMWKTGHSLIKAKLKEEKAFLAGEMSGHIFFSDRYFGYDDAIYASCRLLQILFKAGPPFSIKSLLRGVPRTSSTPEIRFDCPDDVKFRVVEDAREAFKEYPSSTIDGIRIHFDNGWALIRASNTQPALVMRFEAADDAELKKIRAFVEERLDRILQRYKGIQ